MADTEEMQAARERLKSRFGGGASKLGGRGTVRRKKRANHRSSATDDKKLQSALKRLGVNMLSAVSEVQMFMSDDTCMVFEAGVKVQVNIQANTYVISGSHTSKPASEVMKSNGLGGLGGMDMAQLQAMMQAAKAAEGASGEAEGAGDDAGDDDALPDLVPDFEDVSEEASS